MDNAIDFPPQSDEPSHESLGQADGLPTSLDAPITLPYDRITQDRHIRVIDLAPGSWDEPVVCSLREVHLDDDDLRYEAISYAWGDPKDRKTVVCNGHVVSTTRSLFEALQRFRCADTTRTLWADALCINQADNDERTSQVRLMSFIYTKAVRVLVWLQHEDDQVVQNALNAICRYVLRSVDKGYFPQIVKHLQYSQMLYKWRGVTVTSVSGDDPPDLDLAAINALCYICSSRWFSRGWVIQEVALGTSASVFWGHAEIGFVWLGLAALAGVASFSNVSTSAMRHCYFVFELCPSFSTFYPQRKSCFSLLQSTMHATFSDPRDRIYGLLGLKTIEYDPADGRLLVDPDYGITTMECYRRVARKLLLQWHDLRVLGWAGCSSTLVENWPSWVPDWKSPRLSFFGPLLDHQWRDIGISNFTTISEIFKSGRSCVQISGFRVDVADRTVNECAGFTELGDVSSGPRRLQAILRSLAHGYSQKHLAYTFGNRSRYLPLSSTRTANLLAEYHTFMNKDFTQGIHQPVPLELSDEDHQFSPFLPNGDSFFEQFLLHKTGHTLLITSTGMLVLGPDQMLPRDVAVVLHGYPIPFILRPASDGLWRLVGECYVYDVNEGRIHREWEEKGSVSEKFCIY